LQQIKSGIKPAVLFGCFVCWLTAFPMGGLPVARADLPWFLLPHVLGLLVIYRFARPASFLSVFRFGLAVSILLTLAALGMGHDDAMTWMLVPVGLSAAPIAVGMGMMLRSSAAPVAIAAAGLVIGNVGTVVLAGAEVSLPLAGLIALILGAVVTAQPRQEVAAQTPTPGLLRYLPFIFAFEIISGLMFVVLLPDYLAVALWPGSEILAYIGAALAAAHWPLFRRAHRLLAAGVSLAICGMLSWYALPSPLSEHVAIHLLMAAFGAVNMLLLTHVLRFDNQLRAHSLGLAALCSGIAGGYLLYQWLGPWLDAVAIIGMVSLNLAVLVLYVIEREMPGAAVPSAAAPQAPPVRTRLEDLLTRLSAQEQQVLEAATIGLTYRAISEQLGVSESSVKTYMQRIYRKAGVFSRPQLMAWLEQPNGADNDGGKPLTAAAPSQVQP